MNDDQQDALRILLDSLPAEVPSDPAEQVPEDLGDASARGLLYALLRGDASAAQAHNAISRIRSAVVDLNELRIAYPDEIASLLGPRYPEVHERCERMRAVLCSVFAQEHEIGLNSLFEMPKRDARNVLEGLSGVTPFVALRVGLCVFGIHGMPVDKAMCAGLIAAGVLEEGALPADAAAQLERAVRAADSRDTFLKLEAWADDGCPLPKGKRKAKAAAKGS